MFNRHRLITKLPLVVLFLLSTTGYPQRYLSEVFTSLDSTIAGSYGNAINHQSVSQNLLFDFYAPANDVIAQRPLIIYIHGGGFTSGSRTLSSIQKICRIMARKGYAVANIDYRLDPTFQLYNSASDRRAMTDAMHDAKQAIRYFKSNYLTYGIDTARVFVGGESAGAITAMMASYVDKQAEMSVYPMANPNDPIGSSAHSGASNDVQATLCLCGMIIDTSALESAMDSKLLWVHGTNDNFIPITLSFPVVLRANNLGLPITAKTYQGATHCPWFFGNPDWEFYLDSVVTDITNFLYPLATDSTLNTYPNVIDQEVSVFPNPFNDILNIRSKRKLNKATVKIISNEGVIRYKQNNIPNTHSISINTIHLEPGFYFLIIQDETGSMTKKLVKN